MCFNSLYYYRLLKEKGNLVSNFTKQIEKDLHRTFPEENFFKNPNNFSVLKNILVAYSYRNPNVGYCQGMNFIAGRFFDAWLF
jgi:GTPase-activating protein